ncbi:hypothetical protein BRC77_06695 [Halobacteriales archaeon QH_8_64_26]|jgi:hypothetical protein|nr:MAG: hypothetical protein BRC77_06695 [Halobacteriales archaeon QH_8_64_26]
MNDDERVMIVAVVDETFDIARHHGFYPSPISYERATEPASYLALYRTAPQSAITHYAPIEDRFEDGGSHADIDWFDRLIGSRSSDETAMVFRLGDLTPLDRPVVNDTDGVRGAWYATLDALEAATDLSELEP